MEPLVIGQAQSLEFVNRQNDFGQRSRRDSSGFE